MTMNIFQKTLSLFGRQYVLLVHHDGDRVTRHAYTLGNDVYAHPHEPRTRCRLLPGGKAIGQCYIHGWEPITPKTVALYNSLSREEAVKRPNTAQVVNITEATP